MKKHILFYAVFICIIQVQLNSQIACRTYLNLALGADGTATISPFDVLIYPTSPAPGARYWTVNGGFNCADVGTSDTVLITETRGGRSNSCICVVTVLNRLDDPDPCRIPYVLCYTNVTVALDRDGEARLNPRMVSPVALDPAFDWTVSPSSFDCEDVGRNAARLIATSSNGTTEYCILNVNVEDRRPGPPVCYRLFLDNDVIEYFPLPTPNSPWSPGNVINFRLTIDKDKLIKKPFSGDFNMVLSTDDKMDGQDFKLFSKNIAYKNKVNSVSITSKFQIPQNVPPGQYFILADVFGDNSKEPIAFKNYIQQINIAPTPQVNTNVLENRVKINDEISVFPNPTAQNITLKVDQVRFQEYVLSDVYGQTVTSGIIRSMNTNIDLSQYASGIYIIQIQDYSDQKNTVIKVNRI